MICRPAARLPGDASLKVMAYVLAIRRIKSSRLRSTEAASID